MKISNKLTLFILIMLVLTLSLSGGIFYFITRESSDKQLQMHLESVSVIKKNQLDHYFWHQENEIEDISNNVLLEAYNSYEEYSLLEEELRELLLEDFKDRINHTEFFEIFLMNKDGVIIFSTDSKQEGKIKKSNLYFEEGKESTFIQKYYYSLSLGEPAITVSRPVKDDGELKGVVAARVDLEDFSKIMNENAGLGESGETYLVNKFNYAVTELKKSEGSILKTTVNTEAVSNCLEDKIEDIRFGVYEDYNKDTVLGAYNWLSDSEICMIVEIDEDEAYKTLSSSIRSVVIVLTVLLLIISISAFFFTKRIIRPLGELKEGTKKIAEGDLDYKLNTSSKDEIGDVARSFNEMSKELKKSQKEIKSHEKELEKIVEKRTKKLQEKLDELEKFQKLTVGRELKMVELKDKLKELKEENEK